MPVTKLWRQRMDGGFVADLARVAPGYQKHPVGAMSSNGHTGNSRAGPFRSVKSDASFVELQEKQKEVNERLIPY